MIAAMRYPRPAFRPLAAALLAAALALPAAAAEGPQAYPNKPGKKNGPTGKIGAVVGPAPPAAPGEVLGASGQVGAGASAPDYGFVASPTRPSRDPGVEIGFRAEPRFRNKGPGS